MSTKLFEISPQFVDRMPEVLENGIFYVCERYSIALHNCCCGCVMEVSTPLSETEYHLGKADGKVSLWPSVGNHDFPCESHYVIEKNKVIWAGKMSRVAIERGRRADLRMKRPPFGTHVRRTLSKATTWIAKQLRMHR